MQHSAIHSLFLKSGSLPGSLPRARSANLEIALGMSLLSIRKSSVTSSEALIRKTQGEWGWGWGRAEERKGNIYILEPTRCSFWQKWWIKHSIFFNISFSHSKTQIPSPHWYLVAGKEGNNERWTQNREAEGQGSEGRTCGPGAPRERKPQACFHTVNESLCLVFLKPAGHDWRWQHSTCSSIAVECFYYLKQNKARTYIPALAFLWAENW